MQGREKGHRQQNVIWLQFSTHCNHPALCKLLQLCRKLHPMPVRTSGAGKHLQPLQAPSTVHAQQGQRQCTGGHAQSPVHEASVLQPASSEAACKRPCWHPPAVTSPTAVPCTEAPSLARLPSHLGLLVMSSCCSCVFCPPARRLCLPSEQFHRPNSGGTRRGRRSLGLSASPLSILKRGRNGERLSPWR